MLSSEAPTGATVNTEVNRPPAAPSPVPPGGVAEPDPIDGARNRGGGLNAATIAGIAMGAGGLCLMGILSTRQILQSDDDHDTFAPL